MIQITPHMKIYLCQRPVDFRKGIDGLSAICRQELKIDPFSGSMFIFCNKRRSGLKILLYDGQGYWLFMKRLSQGRFCWWPDVGAECKMPLSAPQLQLLIWNGNVGTVRLGRDWRKISQS